MKQKDTKKNGTSQHHGQGKGAEEKMKNEEERVGKKRNMSHGEKEDDSQQRRTW